jgi:DNA-binding beta-propeller fold protein YncE
MLLCLVLLTIIHGSIAAAEAGFSVKPSCVKDGAHTKITFSVAAPTDVEVAIVNRAGKVIRHLAAGVLGAQKDPPPPLIPGLSQELNWDHKDDLGNSVPSGPAQVRVRAGFGVKFGRFIGADPYNFGSMSAWPASHSVATDEDGNLYVSTGKSMGNQGTMTVRVFDSEGRYLRELAPFPASLPPDSMKEVARWDDERKTFFLRNLRNLNPDFYGVPGGYFTAGPLRLLSASKESGLVFTDGRRLCTLDLSGAVRGANFAGRNLGAINNSGGGPEFLTISPDGKWVYLSGPFSNNNSSGATFDPNCPPGRVYRAELAGGDKFKEFTTIPVTHSNGNPTTAQSGVRQVAVDRKGNVYVADREHGCVAVFDESGKAIGKISVKNPNLVAVHPGTGAVYVTRLDYLPDRKYASFLYKYTGFAEGAQPVATFDFPAGGAVQSMALSRSPERTVLWLTGLNDALTPLADKGSNFERLNFQLTVSGDEPTDWNRMSVDYGRDEVYANDGAGGMWRFNGLTGVGEKLKKDGKVFPATDAAVGYDGLLYLRSHSDYSGPLERYTRELVPAPFSGTGTHVLSPYLYGRMGVAFDGRGFGIGPDGKTYVSFMFFFSAYCIGGFDGDGKPLNGKYDLNGDFPVKHEKGANAKPADEMRKQYPVGWTHAVIGPIPQANSGIRVDLKGNIYVGMMYREKTPTPPKGFEKDQAYRVSVGSVVKFGPEGGTMPGERAAQLASKLEGVLQTYPGLAPYSSATEGFGGNTCCVCRAPRFDLDRYGRLALPNAITSSVLLYDNAGNLIAEFGKYGNFDSQYVNPNTDAGKAGKPTVAVPEIPMAWPTGAGFSEDHIYVNDTQNRRAMRLDTTWKFESIVAVD